MASTVAAGSMRVSARNRHVGVAHRDGRAGLGCGLQEAPGGVFPLDGHCRRTDLAAAVATNSVSLDPGSKDAWGLPAIRVTYKDHPDDLANARFLQDRGCRDSRTPPVRSSDEGPAR